MIALSILINLSRFVLNRDVSSSAASRCPFRSTDTHSRISLSSFALSPRPTLSVAMSADLIWQVLRTHNSHIVKRDGITLSGEPGNLTNLHTYKFSGLANPLTVHVALKDKKIALTKNRSAARQHSTPQHFQHGDQLSSAQPAQSDRQQHLVGLCIYPRAMPLRYVSARSCEACNRG